MYEPVLHKTCNREDAEYLKKTCNANFHAPAASETYKITTEQFVSML